MFKNYLKISWRNATRQSTYSMINVFGLALGLAATIIITLYVHFELSYDKFHNSYDRIFRLVMMDDHYTEGGIAKIFTPAGQVISEELSEVEAMTRIISFGAATFKVGDKILTENNGFTADETFFEIFDFMVLQGDVIQGLTEPNSLIITKSMSEKYFADRTAINEVMLISNNFYSEKPYRVAAVVEDVPLNSHFSFDFLAPVVNTTLVDPNDWRRRQAYTYLKLFSGTDITVIENKVLGIIREYSPEVEEEFGTIDADITKPNPFKLQPLAGIYLNSDLFRELGPTGDLRSVRIMMTLATLVVIIAMINFVNLSTARASTRVKEVGIRKANGARRKQLIFQFLAESVMFSLGSLIMAIGMVELVLPYVNAQIGTNISLDYSTFLGWLIIAAFGVGVIAGVYPAFYLSSFSTARILKHDIKFSSKSKLRQGLVIFQFLLSSGLIISSLIIYEQLSYMKAKDLGFDQNHIVTFKISSDKLRSSHRSIINELKAHPNISQASFSGNLPGGGDWGIPFSFEGIGPEEAPNFRVLEVDENFIETFEMDLLKGRVFSGEIGTDVTGSFIINEEGAKQLGWIDPIGKNVSSKPLGWEGKVIGIVKDFHFRSLHETISPVIICMQPEWSTIYSVRLISDDLESSFDHIRDVIGRYDSSYPIEFEFFDQQIDQLYQAEERLQLIVTWFTILTIAIAGIGLFGLSAYSATHRTKEFCIRKIVGANVPQLVGLLSFDFLKLIMISFAISVPVTYLVIDQWLGNFAYQIDISPVPFITTLIAVMLFSLLTIIYQALKVARSNPIDSLRYE